MPSDQQQPAGGRLVGRAIRSAIPGALHRRWRRWRWLSGPLPQDWWPQFERDFRAYCGAAAAPPRRRETDR